jgi:hypothetical protein
MKESSSVKRGPKRGTIRRPAKLGPGWKTVREASEETGIPVLTINAMVRRGAIPRAYKWFHLNLIPREWVEEQIAILSGPVPEETVNDLKDL